MESLADRPFDPQSISSTFTVVRNLTPASRSNIRPDDLHRQNRNPGFVGRSRGDFERLYIGLNSISRRVDGGRLEVRDKARVSPRPITSSGRELSGSVFLRYTGESDLRAGRS